MTNPVQFIQQVRDELVKVTWPTRAQTISMTLVVVGASIAVGLYVGGLDAVFTTIFNSLIASR